MTLVAPARLALEDLDTTAIPPVSLEELNAAASLLTRVDRKYLVPAAAAQDLLDAVSHRAAVLEIEGTRSFAYASTYFDTPALDSYFMAARKRRRRFKVRSRSYLDSGLAFMEVKTRGARGATVKERIAISDGVPHLDAQARGFVAGRLEASGVAQAMLPGLREGAGRHVAGKLIPVMSTRYRRTTLLLPGDDARLTLDSRLVWDEIRSNTTHGRRRSAGDLVVVETKNPATPSPADRWLWAAGFRPATVSKYATGMALLHPELPSNKWHRVMTHDLAA